MTTAQPPNPYAPPRSEGLHGDTSVGEVNGVWQELGSVVCVKGAPWPDRCVRCNEPAAGYRLKRDLYWHPSWVYALIFAGVLVYVIVALIVRKTATVHVGLCPQHRASRRNGILLGWLGSLAAIGTCSVTVAQNPGAGLGIGFLGVLVFAIVGAVMARGVLPTRIDDTYAWVRCGRPFVASLPQIRTARNMR